MCVFAVWSVSRPSQLPGRQTAVCSRGTAISRTPCGRRRPTRGASRADPEGPAEGRAHREDIAPFPGPDLARWSDALPYGPPGGASSRRSRPHGSGGPQPSAAGARVPVPRRRPSAPACEASLVRRPARGASSRRQGSLGATSSASPTANAGRPRGGRPGCAPAGRPGPPGSRPATDSGASAPAAPRAPRVLPVRRAPRASPAPRARRVPGAAEPPDAPAGNTVIRAVGAGGKPFDVTGLFGDDRLMFRYAFPLAESAVADAPKAAVLITVAAAEGARS